MDAPDADSPSDTDTTPDADSPSDTDTTPDADSPSDTDTTPDDDGANSNDAVSDTDAGGDDPGDEAPEPTPQSAALRRQQLYVGYGGALVAGAALGVGTFQQFTDDPVLAALAAVAGTALVVWLVRKSIFPGEPAVE